MKRIGIYDSGCGGLTVLNEVLHQYDGDVYYFGDSKNNPWGNKSKKDILIYLSQIKQWFKDNSVSQIITGCNTSLSLFEDELESIFECPVKNILSNTEHLYNKNNYSVLLTENSHKFKLFTNILKNHNVEEIPCPDLAKEIESNNINKAIDLACKYIEMATYKDIVLGCTHYPIIQKDLTSIYPNYSFINPAKFIQINSSNYKNNKKKVVFKITGDTSNFHIHLSNIVNINQFVLNNIQYENCQVIN